MKIELTFSPFTIRLVPSVLKIFETLGVLLLATLAFANCSPGKKIAGRPAKTPLEKALAVRAADFDSILARPEIFEVQIIYTQIDRDADQKPHFTTWAWNADSAHYFYPASMVKMPLALLSLEKINFLRKNGYPRLSRDAHFQIDSLRPFQQKVAERKGAPNGKPSVGQAVREIFAVSDNESYNHLFEFLGREHINNSLRRKGYARTGIMHRFYAGGRENRFGSPISFVEKSGGRIWKQGETEDPNIYQNPQKGVLKGIGYRDSRDSLVQKPFDFAPKNWFSLHDMEKMLRAVIFPEAAAPENRFDLTEDDYQFLYRCMGLFPRESIYPKYDEKEYWDGYVKFFMFGDSKERRDGKIRIFNKVGEAYGTLTDAAYVVDFENKVEFILAATILCNRDGVFNDDKYEYDSVGFPFLAKLGWAVYDFELKRKRRVMPDLTKFEDAVRF